MVFSISTIEKEEIRGKVEIGNSLVIQTPKVTGFTVNQSRSNPSASFNATVKLDSSELAILQDEIANQDPEEGSLGPIRIYVKVTSSISGGGEFVRLIKGFIRSVKVDQSFLTPGLYIVSLSGNDKMFVLENRGYSRRVKTDGLGVFAVITGVVRKASDGAIGKYAKGADGIGRPGGRGQSDPGEGVNLSHTPKLEGGRGQVRGVTGRMANLAFGASSSGGFGSSSANANEQLVIAPRTALMYPDGEKSFLCSSNCPELADDSGGSYTWSVEDSTIGKFVDSGGSLVDTIESLNPAVDGVTYRHLEYGDNLITLTSPTNLYGQAEILGMPEHAHTSLGQGGPAYGVFATVDDE